MSAVATDTTSEAYNQFGKWLLEQPFWLQDATYRIYTAKKIDDEQIKLYAEMCIAQSKRVTPAYDHLAPGELVQTKSEEMISVLSLSDVHGVNALADNASLDFSGQGVSIIYGLNGAGKSGYMRVFKQLSGSPYKEPIQPNIFKKTGAASPSCKVVVSQGGKQVEEVYDLTSKQNTSLLSVCDVFDTRISSQYISSTSNVSYQPFVFTVLSELAPIADRISKYIAALKESVSETSITLPSDMVSSAYLRWLTSISRNTVIPNDYLIWDDAKEKEYKTLPKLLDTEGVKQRLKSATTARNAFFPIFEDIRIAIESFDRESFEAAYQKLTGAKRRYESAQLLFSETANKQDKISINSEDWKALWASARKYYESVLFGEKGVRFEEEGAICPLCHQSMTGEVHKRVNSVDQYINGSCTSEYQYAQKEFRRVCSVLTNRSLSAATITTSMSSVLSAEDLNIVTDVYKAIEALKTASDDEQRYIAVGKVQLTKAKEIAVTVLGGLDREIETLQNALRDDGRAKQKDRFDQLSAQKWVFDNREAIQRVIRNLDRLAELEETKQYLTTNKITIESNKLADSLITQAYIERFTKELSQMAPGLKVKLEKAPSQKGNSPYKVTIDAGDSSKYKPEDILSEGEQRVVALAAFFADATGRDELTPIIIDDPISSLDLNFEENATKRIVEIAKTRQVIVFTHRISLLVGMGEACNANDVPVKEMHIRSAAKGKGIPDFEESYHGKVKSQLGGLKDRLVQAKKMDVDSAEYRDCIGRICQQFRICVERSVEDELLLGIVRRFHRNIRTNNMVMKLAAIEEKDCKIVDDMMTKYSFIEHSQPSDTYFLQYSIDEIEADIQIFIDWISEYKKKQKL